MIRLSKLTDYAFVILTEMTKNMDKKMPVSALSSATSLSKPTVSKVLKVLSKNKMVSSVRGINGGYFLAMNPDDISLARVVGVMEGDIAFTDCVNDNTCIIKDNCALKGCWNPINDVMKTILDGVYISDLSKGNQSSFFAKAITSLKNVEFG